MFIGLNPSTANETMDDPTIRKVKKFAERWGYGGVYMMNLFALVSTDPKGLLTCENPVGDNNAYLSNFSNKCKTILCAWGNFKQIGSRDFEVRELLAHRKDDMRALHINKNGSPKHPLYVADATDMISYQ
jgi:hypothetical protein